MKEKMLVAEKMDKIKFRLKKYEEAHEYIAYMSMELAKECIYDKDMMKIKVISEAILSTAACNTSDAFIEENSKAIDQLLYGSNKVKRITNSGWDISNVTSIADMLEGYRRLEV